MPKLCLFTELFRGLGSANEIQLYAESADAARRLMETGIGEARRIEAKYSRYLDESVTSVINRAAGGAAIEIDDETASLLDYADACYKLSGGLFDLTSGVLRRVWNFKEGIVPDAAAVSALLPLVGWGGVERGGETIRLPKPGMEIDFGGIGKEYCADRVAAIMAEAGATHGFVNLGGDVRVIGPHPDGTPWAIGIRHPRKEGQLLATIDIAQGALATSGDYERYFEIDGRRYCHVLNPRTGYPVNAMQSVSVVAPLCTVAGSVCTIAMLKEESAIEFLESQGFPYLAVDGEGKTHGALA
jgi:thiamine biosynthesis lipoprotein